MEAQGWDITSCDVGRDENFEDGVHNSGILFLQTFLSHALAVYNKNKIEYFTNIYAKNCDIFGFLTCYIDSVVF